VVVALGGNAILREGESLTQENQERNIQLATRAIANVIKKGDWNVVVTHGNGPQVGFLALKQESFGLDVLTAETQGMIGWQLDEALESELPGRAVTNLMTQVEVDGEDPAFKNPTKPVGPFYDHYDEKFAPMVQVGNKWRKVVASPKPVNILDIKTIRALVTAGNTVICCGGGGIPVIKKDGKVAGVPAVVDKDRTSGLLAANLACDAFIMLTDADALYKDWGKPTQAKIDKVEVENVDPAFLASLPAGSIRPKVQSAIDFVKSGNGWAAIGSLDNLQDVLDGKSGTRFVRAATSKITTQTQLPDHIQEWSGEELGRWMLHDLRMREQTVVAVLKHYKTGREIASAEPEHLMQRCGLSAMMASHLVNEQCI
jgi:carbamate kinase